ncbi:MAG: SfnB family sulfur acquisition oxidoreductase, partial [Pseudomonadota bacterium]
MAHVFAKEASHRDRERRLPWDEIAYFTASGLGGITVPAEYGGADVSMQVLSEVFRILCAADPAAGQIPQNQFGVLNVVRAFATQAQKQRIYGAVLAGHRLGNTGPERNTKSIAQITSRLVRQDGILRLTGQKFYSTGALFAHHVPARAIDDDGRTVMVFVPRGRPGLRIVDDWSGFGQRTTASGTVIFDGVPIEADEVVDIHAFADTPNLQGPSSQLIQASIDMGIADAAVAETIAFVRHRARAWMDSGVTEASQDPLTIHQVGELHVRLSAAQALLEKAARTIDDLLASVVTAESVARASVEVAKAKVLTTEVALHASQKLFELSGTRSVLAEDNLDRHWRNARTHTLHDPVRWK